MDEKLFDKLISRVDLLKAHKNNINLRLEQIKNKKEEWEKIPSLKDEQIVADYDFLLAVIQIYDKEITDISVISDNLLKSL